MRKPTRFDLRPDAKLRQQIARDLGLVSVQALRFTGEIRPAGSRDFLLDAKLTALIEQPCAITLAPVPAQIAETVQRRYLSDWTEPTGDEAEMPEDDTMEGIPEVIDAGHVALEALVLALPLYPRAPGAALGAITATPPGAAPLGDAELKPFASLAALRTKLEGGSDA
jgi:uncharacterized metal-binding protein YceD (DUF177 family)